MSDDRQIVEQVRELADRALARVQRGDAILPRLLDINDAARYLAMSDKGIRDLIQRGEINYIQKVTGRSPYLLDRLELDQWVLKNKLRSGE